MKPTNLIAIVVPLVVGVAAALWTPLQLWFDMKEGLIAFLGFLSASLVQVMPLTANFLQSDRLSPREAERLTASLTKQQHYWMGLLSATISALIIVIVGAALHQKLPNLPLLAWSTGSVSWAQAVSFCIAASVTFVLAKMFGLFEGLMSLHRLRVELVINAANREAAERVVALQERGASVASIIPEDYGRVVRPH